MSETLTTYTTMVQNEVDDTSSSAQVVIQNNIKEIYQEILRLVGHQLIGTETETITLVVGTRTYTPSDFMEIYAVHHRNGTDDWRELIEMDKAEYLSRDVNQENGTPVKYFLNGLKIELDRPSDQAGSLRVELMAVPSIVNGASVIPSRFSNVVKLGACYRFFAYEKGAESENYYQWYQIALRDMMLELSTRNPQVQPTLYDNRRDINNDELK